MFWLRTKGGALPGALGRQAWRCFRSPSHHWSRCRHDEEVRTIETARIGAEHGTSKANQGKGYLKFYHGHHRVEILLRLAMYLNSMSSSKVFELPRTTSLCLLLEPVVAAHESLRWAKDFQGQKLCGLGPQRQQKGLASLGPVWVSWRDWGSISFATFIGYIWIYDDLCMFDLWWDTGQSDTRRISASKDSKVYQSTLSNSWDLPPGFWWLLGLEASISEPFPHFPSVFHTSLVALCQSQAVEEVAGDKKKEG